MKMILIKNLKHSFQIQLMKSITQKIITKIYYCFFKFYRSINLWVRKVKMNKGIFESNNNKIDLENSNELFYKNFNSSIISKPII